MNNGGTGLVVLLLGDPHSLEGGKGSKDGATDPDGVLPLRGGNNLDGHSLGGHGFDLLGHALGNAVEHSGTAGKNGVGVKVLANINIALHDGLVGGLGDTILLKADERGLEENLGAAETLVTDGDDLSVRKLVVLLELGGFVCLLELTVEINGDVGKLLLDVTDNFALGGSGEGVATLGQDLHHVVGEIAASKIETHDSVGKSVTLVNGDGVGNTISRVEDDTGGTAGSVQGKDSLDGDVHSGGVEGLEHDLGHLLTVSLRVKGCLGKEDGVLLRGNTKLVVEGVVPDLLHIVPVGYDTVLDGVLQGKDTTLGLGLVSDVGILLSHADHDTLVTGAADDGGEDCAGGVVSGETGLAHTGSVVDNEGLDIILFLFVLTGATAEAEDQVKG